MNDIKYQNDPEFQKEWSIKGIDNTNTIYYDTLTNTIPYYSTNIGSILNYPVTTTYIKHHESVKSPFSNGYYETSSLEIEVIGLIGPIGSGKDYRANVLSKEGYIKVSFADVLRESVWRLLGWKPENDDEYRSFKNQVYGRGIFTGRDIMLQMEKEIKDYEGNAVFINKTFEKILFLVRQDKANRKFVISDLRFLEEYEALKSFFKKFKVIFCNYKSSQYKLLKHSLSESLAVSFVKLGMRDGQVLTANDFLLLTKAPEDFL